MAKEVLRGNEINENEFSQAVQTLLVNGRGKYRNIMILGAANCGKTFLLNPLNAIYNCFANPATTSFAWVGKVQSIAQPGKTYSFFFRLIKISPLPSVTFIFYYNAVKTWMHFILKMVLVSFEKIINAVNLTGYKANCTFIIISHYQQPRFTD